MFLRPPPLLSSVAKNVSKTEKSGNSSAGAANRAQKLQLFLMHASGAEISFTRAVAERGSDRGARTSDWCTGVLGQRKTVIAVAKVCVRSAERTRCWVMRPPAVHSPWKAVFVKLAGVDWVGIWNGVGWIELGRRQYYTRAVVVAKFGKTLVTGNKQRETLGGETLIGDGVKMGGLDGMEARKIQPPI